MLTRVLQGDKRLKGRPVVHLRKVCICCPPSRRRGRQVLCVRGSTPRLWGAGHGRLRGCKKAVIWANTCQTHASKHHCILHLTPSRFWCHPRSVWTQEGLSNVIPQTWNMTGHVPNDPTIHCLVFSKGTMLVYCTPFFFFLSVNLLVYNFHKHSSVGWPGIFINLFLVLTTIILIND